LTSRQSSVRLVANLAAEHHVLVPEHQELSILGHRRCVTDSFLGAKYRRLNKRTPKRKALVASGNSVLTIYHPLLSDPAASYHDLGPGYYEQRANIRRQARNHLKGLERLGDKVTIEPLTPDTRTALPATAS
jgi:hypothetical protein